MDGLYTFLSTEDCFSDFPVRPAGSLCSPGDHGSCSLHRSVIVGAGRWVAGKCSGWEDLVLPGLEEEWFWQFFQASSCFKIGFSLKWRWKYLARSSYSVFAARHWNSPCADPPNTWLAAGRRAIWIPSPCTKVQVMKPAACSAWAGSGTHRPLMVGKFPPVKIHKGEATSIWRI